MSLYEIFLNRAMLDHQNMLASDTTGTILESLAQGVSKGVEAEQVRVQKQRDEDRVATKRMEQFTRILSAQEKGGIPGAKIRTSIDKEGNTSFSITGVDEEEEKYRQESLKIRQENLNQKILEEKRRVLTSKLNNARQIGGIINPDEMAELNEGMGFDLGTDLNTGRIEQTPEGKYRILSNEEYSKKSDIIKTVKDAESKLNLVEADIEQMSKIYDTIPKVNTGAIQGRTVGLAAGFMGEENVRALEDIRGGVLGNISRGLLQEVGVLTDQDVKRAKELLPKLTDSVAVKTRNLAELKQLINSRRAEFNRRQQSGMNSSTSPSSDGFSNLWK